jgi:hypothetical protein
MVPTASSTRSAAKVSAPKDDGPQRFCATGRWVSAKWPLGRKVSYKVTTRTLEMDRSAAN